MKNSHILNNKSYFSSSFNNVWVSFFLHSIWLFHSSRLLFLLTVFILCVKRKKKNSKIIECPCLISMTKQFFTSLYLRIIHFAVSLQLSFNYIIFFEYLNLNFFYFFLTFLRDFKSRKIQYNKHEINSNDFSKKIYI